MVRPFRSLFHRAQRKPVRRDTWTRLAIEPLEDRCLPSLQAAFSAYAYPVSDNASQVALLVQLSDSINVTRLPSHTQTVSIKYYTWHGSAQPGTDYIEITNGTLTWGAGNTASQPIYVTIVPHTGLNRSFYVTLTVDTTGPGGIQPGAIPTAVVPISDPNSPPVSPPAPPPAPPSIQFSSPSYSTSDQVPAVSLTITSSQPPSTVGVSYTTHDLTATSGTDYIGTDHIGVSNSVTFSSASATISIMLVDDHRVEPDETFSVTLDSVSGGVLGLLSRAIVTIHDADTSAPKVTLSNATVKENAGPAQLTATLSRPYSIPFTVPYQTINGSATAPGDYTAIPAGTLTIPANQPSQKIYVPILNDNDPDEPAKSFTVSVSGGVNTNYLYNVYSDLLFRDADGQGLPYWNGKLSNGMTRKDVARKFQASAEYLPALVDGAFQHYLFRQADPSGISYWTAQLVNVPGFTPEDLIGNILGSSEYFATRASQDNGTFVQMIYWDLLGRPATSADINSRLQQLGSGMTRAQVATAVAKSAEYYGDYAAAMYLRYLRRFASNTEASNWANPLSNGQLRSEDFVASLISSDEYWNNLFKSTAPVAILDPPDLDLTIANNGYVPVNADDDNGSTITNGIPASRDFSVAPILGGDPDLVRATITVTALPLDGDWSISIEQINGGKIALWKDSAKSQAFTSPPPDQATTVFWIEGVHESSSIGDINITVIYFANSTRFVDSANVTVTPLINNFSVTPARSLSGGQNIFFTNGTDGLQGLQAAALDVNPPGPGATFYANVTYTGLTGNLVFIQNIRNGQNGYNGTTGPGLSPVGALYTVGSAPLARNAVLITGAFPVLDANPAPTSPDYTFGFVILSRDGNTYSIDADDSPTTGVPTNPARVVAIDFRYSFRLHLLWKYNQGPKGVYYPLAYVGWVANFYATGNGPVTVIQIPHGVTADGTYTESNTAPAAMTAPVWNGNNKWS